MITTEQAKEIAAAYDVWTIADIYIRCHNNEEPKDKDEESAFLDFRRALSYVQSESDKTFVEEYIEQHKKNKAKAEAVFAKYQFIQQKTIIE